MIIHPADELAEAVRAWRKECDTPGGPQESAYQWHARMQARYEAVKAALARFVARRDEQIQALVDADSELSAIAHGRPASAKEELVRIYSALRRMYDPR